jgi:hypothetical protein
MGMVPRGQGILAIVAGQLRNLPHPHGTGAGVAAGNKKRRYKIVSGSLVRPDKTAAFATSPKNVSPSAIASNSVSNVDVKISFIMIMLLDVASLRIS